jgi:hypothetical protein
MRLVPPRREWLRGWLDDEPPGPDAIAGHVLSTGNGRCWVDDPGRPRAVLVETGGNYLLGGDPAAVDSVALRPLVTGVVAAPQRFEPLLDNAFERVLRWDRVVYGGPPRDRPQPTASARARPLTSADAEAVGAMHPDSLWIAKTWGGPAGLAGSGLAWGSFAGTRLVAIACTFFLGARHHELGVVTDPDHQGAGRATACARGLCDRIWAAGERASWSTSVDNVASRRLAVRLGFEFDRSDLLYAVGMEPPSWGA